MKTSSFIVETDRLILRELTPEDFNDLYEISRQPAVAKFIDSGENKETEFAKLTAYITYVYGFYGFGLWGVFHRSAGKLIGRCGIELQTINDKTEIMLSYLLHRDYWGQGLASESCRAVFDYARNELDIHRIVAVIDKTNNRSLRTASRLGMTKEESIRYQDRDCFLYSISL